jgi:hypothetical protein
MPADGKPNVLLRVSTRAPGTLTVRYADAPAMAVQTVALSGVADEDVVLRLPQGSRGATLKLMLSSGMQAEELYLILPNEAERKPTSTVALNGEAPAKALAQLANEGGVVVLCPAAFAEQPIYANVSDTTAVNALSTLAARREFQADVCDTVVNIAPNCPAPR